VIPHYDKIVSRAKKICEAKNKDYAKESDPFLNFRLSEVMKVCSLEEAVLVRILDKTARVANLIHKHNDVKDESVEDTILDLINYWIILASYMENE